MRKYKVGGKGIRGLKSRVGWKAALTKGGQIGGIQVGGGSHSGSPEAGTQQEVGSGVNDAKSFESRE